MRRLVKQWRGKWASIISLFGPASGLCQLTWLTWVARYVLEQNSVIIIICLFLENQQKCEKNKQKKKPHTSHSVFPLNAIQSISFHLRNCMYCIIRYKTYKWINMYSVICIWHFFRNKPVLTGILLYKKLTVEIKRPATLILWILRGILDRKRSKVRGMNKTR